MEEIYELSLREYYNILHDMCEILEKNPDDDTASAAFIDAAYHIAKADCGELFPIDLFASDEMAVNAASTPAEGTIVTGVKEDDAHVIQ